MSQDDCENSYLLTGFMSGTAEDPRDNRFRLYLGDPTARV